VFTLNVAPVDNSNNNKKSHKCVFDIFGKPRERCIKCGAENPVVTVWRQLVVQALENNLPTPSHPYLLHNPKDLGDEPKMTLREYKRAMRSKNF
jgi:hypothetical protein